MDAVRNFPAAGPISDGMQLSHLAWDNLQLSTRADVADSFAFQKKAAGLAVGPARISPLELFLSGSVSRMRSGGILPELPECGR